MTRSQKIVVSGSILITSCCWPERREKAFGQTWDRTQVLLLFYTVSDCFTHLKVAFCALLKDSCFFTKIMKFGRGLLEEAQKIASAILHTNIGCEFIASCMSVSSRAPKTNKLSYTSHWLISRFCGLLALWSTLLHLTRPHLSIFKVLLNMFGPSQILASTLPNSYYWGFMPLIVCYDR